jgi:putative DNA primase/helicase
MMPNPENEKPLNTRQYSRAINQKENRQAHYTHTHDLEQVFKAHIFQEYGLDLVGDLKTDGAFHYLGSTDDKKGHKPLRYCVHVDTPCNVYFNDLKRGFHGTWYPEGQQPLTTADREQQRQRIEKEKAQRKQETYEKHQKRAQWARKLWRTAHPCNTHPYLSKKGVGAYGLRTLPVWERRIYHEDGGGFDLVKIEGVLLVPMKDETGALWNVQAIFPQSCETLERDRDFLPGARVNGLFHWIGQRTETVCLAEGYATGASIYEATGYRVFVCLSAGNLPHVAQAVRAALPDARIVICGDHDKPDQKGRRAGIEKGEEAAALVGGFIALPPIEGADFNDWANSLRMGQ